MLILDRARKLILPEGYGPDGKRHWMNIPAAGAASNARTRIPYALNVPGAAADYLTKTFGAAGNRQQWTLHMAFKPAANGTREFFFTWGPSGNDDFIIERIASNALSITSSVSNATQFLFVTTATDYTTGTWHRISLIYDSTQAVAANRLKLYRNNTLVTSFSSTTDVPLSNSTCHVGAAEECRIGSWNGGNLPYNGLIDGRLLFLNGYTPADASMFYKADGTTPKPTLGSLTYGTTGFSLDFSNSGALGTDISGNSNTFTKNGSCVQTTGSYP